MDNVLADANVCSEGDAKVPCLPVEAGFAVWETLNVFPDSLPNSLPYALMLGCACSNDRIEFSCLLPHAKASVTYVASNAFGCSADMSQFPVMDGAGSVSCQQGYPAPRHEIQDEILDARTDYVSAHH